MRINSHTRVFAASLLIERVLAQNATNSTAYDPLQYVDQLIGSSNGGWFILCCPASIAYMSQETYFRAQLFLMVTIF